jgi:hypothetical protein
MSNSPNRGEVWLVDLGYVAKFYFPLVVSIADLNAIELCLSSFSARQRQENPGLKLKVTVDNRLGLDTKPRRLSGQGSNYNV